MTYNGNVYTGVVKSDSFTGVVLNRVKVELDQITRSDVSFDIVGDYTSGSVGVPVVIREVSGPDVSDMLGAWRFQTETASYAYGVTSVSAIDQISAVIDGTWPNTSLVRDAFPETVFSHAGLDDTACFPVPFGMYSYVPIQSKSDSGEVYYIFGPGTGKTFAITEITSPNNIDNQIRYTPGVDIWPEGSFDGTYEYFQVYLDSGLTETRFWRSGADRVPPLAQIYKAGLSSYTNPVYVLQYVLEDCGIASIDFDPTWDAAAAIVAGRGYTYSRGFYQHEDRSKLVCHLLAACDATLYQSGNRVSIAINSKSSVATIDGSQVLKQSLQEHGDFSWDRTLPDKSDSAYISYFVHGDPQTKLIKAKVTASGTTAASSSDTLDLSGVSSSTAAQALGTLYFRKKFCKSGECSFTGRPELIALKPGQVVTIDGPLYGPTVEGLVESITINKDSTVKVVCSTYSVPILDFSDLSPQAIVPVDDTATGAISTLSQSWGYTDERINDIDPPDTSTWNNRNSDPIPAPTIVTNGNAVDHVINTDSSANISFEWSWGGDEATIDGFQVYWYASASASVYVFGTDPANEYKYPVLPDCRAIVCPSVAANKYYTFGVRAYRKVDPDVATGGMITSTLVSPSLSSENPYQPSSSVAYAGDITGTLNGTAVATVVTNASTGATHAGTAHAPSNADHTQTILSAGAAIDNAKVNGQTLIVGGYINTNVLQVSSTMIVGSLDWSTQIGGTGKPSNYADVTSTIIQGGLTTTGSLVVAQGGSYVAGVTGNTSGDTATRIWAGATFANRDSAPFRVTQAGAVTCSNITITGGSIGSSATINGTTASTVVSQASAGSYHASSVPHAPSDADKTANNTAYDTARVYGITASTIAGWKYAGQTYIDGGKIWTGTVTAYQIATNTITLDRLYAGDTGSITFTGCQMTFGNGADLILQSTSDSSSLIKFERGSYSYEIKLYSSGAILYFAPINGASSTFMSFGSDASGHTTYTIGLSALNSVQFIVGSYNISFNSSSFFSYSALISLGTQTYPWNTIFGNEIVLGSTAASGTIRVNILGRGTGTTTYGVVHKNSSGVVKFQTRDDGAMWSATHIPLAADTYAIGYDTSTRWSSAYIAYVNAVGVNPPTANTGYLGTSSLYYNTCYINNIRYKTSSVFDALDDLDVLHSIGPLLDEFGDPIPVGYGYQAKPLKDIHPAITNYSTLADEINAEWGTTLTFQDLQDIVAETLSPVQADDIDLYAADFPAAFTTYAGKFEGLMEDIDQMVAGEVPGPVTIPGPLIDKDYIEARLFYDGGAVAQLTLGATRQLDLFVTDDVLEQLNSLIEGLTTRLTAAETALAWLTSERVSVLEDIIDWFSLL
jgi:hypothetical protein